MDRPLLLLRFALRARDMPLASALVRRLGDAADVELVRTDRLPAGAASGTRMRAFFEVLAA